MLLYFCIIREVDVNVPGQGHLVPSYLATCRPGQIVRGGSYALARALKHDIWAHGGHIMKQTVPRRILVEGGRATGVELLDGRTIRAGFVASSLNRGRHSSSSSARVQPAPSSPERPSRTDFNRLDRSSE
jgi:hypothetical protein